MSDGDALLKSIIANRDDDTPRLVYADWLEENEQTDRAEFIRLTISYLRLTQLHEQLQAIREDSDQLREVSNAWLETSWKPHLPAGCSWCRQDLKQRGFVEEIECAASTWIANADELLAGHPIRKVIFTTQVDYHERSLLSLRFSGIVFEFPAELDTFLEFSRQLNREIIEGFGIPPPLLIDAENRRT